MNRLDLDPQVSFAEDFKKMITDLEQIKTAQRSGKDIFVPKIVERLDINGNPTQYDLAASTPDGFGGMEARNFIASLQADHQEEVWAVPIFKMYIGTPTTPASSSDIAGFAYLDFPTTIPGKIGYSGYFRNNGFADLRVVYLKVYFYATDTGVLTVVGNP